MNLTPMRFKDYTWPHNPESYRIRYARRMAVHRAPYGRCTMEDLGMSYRVMEGEGTFSGAGAYDEFKKLASVFYESGPGVLVHPVWMTTRAHFVALELEQEPTPELVRYSFTFWEDSAAAVQSRARTHTLAAGETLWSVAQQHGVTLGELLAANGQIRNPGEVAAGEQVIVP